MPALLITGMSGTGKSAVLGELARRGYDVVDTDDGLAVEVTATDVAGLEQVWDEDGMARLLGEPRSGVLVVSGCAGNQGRFYDRFAAVVLLSAPPDVMLDRIAHRGHGFGTAPEERARILADLAHVEPRLRATCTVEVRTDRPLGDVADDVEAVLRGL